MNLKDLSTLQIALGLSVMAHAVLLTVHFVDPESFDRVFQEPPLEVILVNAKSTERPSKAKAVAQASLAGGGDLDKGRATSPLPSSAFTAIGDSTEEAQRQVEAMQAQQMLLMAQVKRQLAAMPLPDPRHQGKPLVNAAREEKRRQLVELLAEIERRVNEENARPRKRYISPATREVAYATYVDTLRRRIEKRGTENFPEAAGRKLYGELVMMVTVNFDGRLLSTEIVQSSGDLTLDRRAQAIVRSIGSFGNFTGPMRRLTDQIALPSRFKFTREATLEAKPYLPLTTEHTRGSDHGHLLRDGQPGRAQSLALDSCPLCRTHGTDAGLRPTPGAPGVVCRNRCRVSSRGRIGCRHGTRLQRHRAFQVRGCRPGATQDSAGPACRGRQCPELSRRRRAWRQQRWHRAGQRHHAQRRCGAGRARCAAARRGGGAAGVLGPLLEAGARRVVVANRTLHKATTLVQRHAALALLHRCTLEAQQLHTIDGAFDVVVNATASSLAGTGVPVAAQVLKPGALAIDMMYGPAAAGFMQWAKAHGAVPRDGLGMLVEQGAEAFAGWRGVRPPTGQVLAELRALLG